MHWEVQHAEHLMGLGYPTLPLWLQLCTGDDHSVADPIDLLRCFAALPLGAELCNGGQHDCQEALRTLLDALHDDLVRPGDFRLAGSGPWRSFWQH